ncbi:MAG: hypothetical protein JNL51_01615 [Chitinophagaceae bacterium]|nr:hypothetical protein [Chitinophagaceae bacterium]
MELKNITAYSVEHSCNIANGYLKKQWKGKGTLGTEILEKIVHQYVDLSLLWLITGEGNMLVYERPSSNLELQDEEKSYLSADTVIRSLNDKIKLLEQAVADKEKIIALLERQINRKGK